MRIDNQQIEFKDLNIEETAGWTKAQCVSNM